MRDLLGDVQPLEVDRPAETELDESGKGCQTDVLGDALRGMEEKMRQLTLENSDLKKQNFVIGEVDVEQPGWK